MKKTKRALVTCLAFLVLLGLFSIRTQASGGRDMSSAQAISLGSDVYGTLVSNQGEDFYRINITDSGVYRFTGSNSISSETRLILLSNQNYDIASCLSTWNNNTGTGIWDFSLSLSRGTYYVTVCDWSSRGDYRFKIALKTSAGETFADQFGDDHNYNTAHQISVGQTINGILAMGEYCDYYRVVVSDSGIYNFQGTTNISSDAQLQIYTEGDNPLLKLPSTWNNNTGSGKWDFGIALSQGTYYIRIYEFDNKGLYSFKMTEKKSAGETFPDHIGDEHQLSTAHNISIGKVINGILTRYEEYDYYRFKVSKAGTYEVSGTSNISADSELSVLDSNGYSVTYANPTWNNSKGSGKWNYKVTLAPGTYYIRVYEYDDTGLYSFSINAHNNEFKNSSLKVPTLKKLQGKKNSIVAKWSTVSSGITGYEIEYSTDKNFKKKLTKSVKITKKSASSHTIKKLKSKTKYYVRIRSYNKNGKKFTYSKWSKAKNINTK